MTDSDTLPWYRQFWPWFLIVLPGSAVVASLYSVSLAVRTSDSLVTSAEGGMDVVVERHLAAERRAVELGLAANVFIDRGSGAVTATLEGRLADAVPAALRLLLSHPTSATRDQVIMLYAAPPDAGGNAAFAGHLQTVPDGRWYLVLTPAGAGGDWRLNGVWHGQGQLRLLPGSGASDEPA